MALPQNKMIPAMAIIGLAGLITLVLTLEPGGWMQKLRDRTTGGQAQAADQDKGSESVEALASEVSSMESQLSKAQAELQAMRELEQQRQAQSDQAFSEKLNKSIGAIKEEYDKTVNDLMNSVRVLSDQLKQPAPAGGQMPVGNGMDTGTLENGFRVYRPLGKGGSGNLFTRAADSTRNAIDGLLGGNPLDPFDGMNETSGESEFSALPVYTVPKNSTLMGATAMTALIGRVPVNQIVFQPLPFKVVMGRENLAANDMWLPDVERMIFEGHASGESTLKCVRGTVNSVTFVFRDGTIRTVPDDNTNSNNGIGWISNEQGYPCIPGQFVTDFPKTLAELGVAGTLAGYADAIADSESSVIVDGGSISRIVTGDSTRYALGRGAQTGFDEAAREIARRARDRYDAVVLQPGAKVAVHISEQLEIDFERGPGARRLNHLARYDAASANYGVD